MSESETPATAADTLEREADPAAATLPAPVEVSEITAAEEPADQASSEPAEAPANQASAEPAEAPANQASAEPAEAPAEASAEPVNQPSDDAAAAVLLALSRLDDRLEENQRLLARQSEIAASLHAENQRLKAGELVRAQLPLVRDIIRVQDDLAAWRNAPDDSIAAEKLADVRRRDLEMAHASLVDALARNGIEETTVETGAPLDPRHHRVVKVTPTDDPNADRTVAEVLKRGFVLDDGTTIRAAEVRVFKHTPAASPAPAPDGDAAQS